MLAQHLDPSRHKPPHDLRAIRRRHLLLYGVEELSFFVRLVFAQSGVEERLCRAGAHSSTLTFCRWSATAAMSERRERSSTPARQAAALNFTPCWIASFTANGNSYSP